MNQPYDCIVIGGGPSGSTTATLLADYGRRVLLLERSKFPRHHIGESLMPNTYYTFKRLGLLEKMKHSDFVVKESVQFVSPTGKESAPFFFPDRDPGEWSYTWQVERDRFDQMLLDNARAHGTEVIEQANVREVIFEGEQAVGVQATINGESRAYHARIIVDATGQAGLLSRQLKMRYGDEKLKNAAIYAYYKGAQRDSGRNAGATLVVSTPEPGGWFWFIPLANDVTSVGVVAPPNYLYNGRGDDPEVILDEEIARCPGASKRLSEAARVSKVYTTADYSYRSKRFAGHGWMLVGDAFGFLDPIYSSGVMLAFKSGEFAADTIHEALTDGDVSAERLGRDGARLADGMQRIRQLVYAFYDPNFSMKGFVTEHPEYRDHITRILIGDVFNDDVAEVFEVMRHKINLPDAIRLEEAVPAP